MSAPEERAREIVAGLMTTASFASVSVDLEERIAAALAAERDNCPRCKEHQECFGELERAAEREAGRREGIEEAAKVCVEGVKTLNAAIENRDSWESRAELRSQRFACNEMASRIRALVGAGGTDDSEKDYPLDRGDS